MSIWNLPTRALETFEALQLDFEVWDGKTGTSSEVPEVVC